MRKRLTHAKAIVPATLPSPTHKGHQVEAFHGNAEWAKLTLAEQIECCRELAAEAQALANESPLEAKMLYESVAGKWIRMATELERETLDGTCAGLSFTLLLSRTAAREKGRNN